MPAILHLLGLLFILTATALFVVVSVGLPIWNDVYFLRANLGGQVLQMGQWGLCFAGRCSATKLGYNTDYITANSAIGRDQNGTFDFNNQLGDTIVEGLTYALVLNPIAAGFSGLALLFALVPALPCGILASILSFWAFIVGCAAVGINFGLFTVARNRLRDQGADADFHNAIWLTVAATACLLLASFTVCFTHRSRKHRRDRDSEARGLTTGEPAPARRGWFGRNKTAAAPYDTTYGNNSTYAPSSNGYAGNGVAPAAPMSEKRHFWQRKAAY